MADEEFDGWAFGRRVASAREWRGLDVKQLAKELGVSKEAVYRIERGARINAPRLPELRLMSDVLQQAEVWLLKGDTPPWRAIQLGAQGKPLQPSHLPKAEGEDATVHPAATQRQMLTVLRGLVAEIQGLTRLVNQRLPPPDAQAREERES